ncbi:MAG: serine/threonine-protein kinase [Jatrophihabitans sp.]|uniref:serine/threonine-protein kinase n=1 Tax=Jatrophihabitans sp. TaxID=1932789 RepID=UPI003F80E952
MSWTVPGYRDVRLLGEGASGRVMLAEHLASGTRVAIKYLSDAVLDDAELLRGLRSEARVLGSLHDPHVATVYEYVEQAPHAAIVLQLVDGAPLRAMLREHGPLEPEAALVVLKGSLLGLAAAHELGVVHRDYKPENVIVTDDGTSMLIDFGVAVPSGAAGSVAGTPGYMAPEQWTGGAATPATDVYAATATFHECLTGEPPFVGDVDQLRRQHQHATPAFDLVDEPLRGLVRHGLAKDAARRPPSASAFVAELDDIAVAAYGADWEERGRDRLARRAALLLALFPLAGAGLPATDLALTRLGAVRTSRGRLLAVTAALTLVAGGGVAVALVPTSSGHHATHRAVAGPGGPTTASTAGTGPSTPAEPHPTPARTRTTPMVRRHGGSPSASPSSPDPASSAPATSTTPTSAPPSHPAPRPSSSARPVPPPPTRPRPGPSRTTIPTPTTPPPPAQHVLVTITSFAAGGTDDSTLVVHVDTTTSAPVTLTIRYLGGATKGAPGAQDGADVSVTLSGRTAYDLKDGHVWAVDAKTGCPPEVWFARVSTDPAADDGTQQTYTGAPTCP